MRRRWRKRRVGKWVATGLLLATLVGWVVSSLWTFGRINGEGGVTVILADGGVTFAHGLRFPGFPRLWVSSSRPVKWGWGLPHVVARPQGHHVWVPFWSFVLFSVSVAGYLWWKDRRFPTGLCLHCGYNLTGNTSGVCPECGESI